MIRRRMVVKEDTTRKTRQVMRQHSRPELTSGTFTTKQSGYKRGDSVMVTIDGDRIRARVEQVHHDKETGIYYVDFTRR